MAADVQLPQHFLNLAIELDDILTKEDKTSLLDEMNAMWALQLKSKEVNLSEGLAIARKQGVIGDGQSTARILSKMAEKTSKPEETKDVIQKYKASMPEKKDVFIGRENDVKEINKRLTNPRVPGINLFGESGVGKTTLAKEVSKQFREFKTLTIDLRDIKDMETVYFLTLLPSGIKYGKSNLQDKIFEFLNQKLTEKTVVIFDNVEQLLNSSHTKKEFTEFLVKVTESNGFKNKLLKFILTSQVQVNESSLKRKYFSEYEVKPLGKEHSKEFITDRRKEVLEILQEELDNTLSEISELCRDIPYLLEKAVQLLRQNCHTPIQVARKITTQIENGVPSELACISALFETIPTDHLKEVAIKISLLRRPFSVSTAMKIAEIPSDYDTELYLESLVNKKIITAEDVDGKRKYDTHGLFKEFVKHFCDKHSGFKDKLIQGEKEFFKHFSGKLTKLANNLESEFVKTYSKLEVNRANFELTLDLSEENKEVFDQLLHTEDHNQFALMGILFEVLKDGHERRDLFEKWAEVAENQGKWLASALMRCWQSVQTSDVEGTRHSESTLKKANECIEKAQQTATTEQMNQVKSLYLHCSGKIKWMDATKLTTEERRKENGRKLLKEGIINLKKAISMRKMFLEGKISTLTARGLNLIGNCYMELQEPNKAKSYYRDAMEMKRRLVGSEDHWEFPTYYNQIAQTHDLIGRLEEKKWYKPFAKKNARKEYFLAVKWMEKSLKLQEKLDVSGTEHTATFKRNLANILIGLGEFDKALGYAKESYELRNKRLGKHPETVRILYLIGIIHEWRNDRQAALQSYEEAFEMEESLPDDNHSVSRFLIRARFKQMCKKLKKMDKLSEFESKIKEIEKEEETKTQSPQETTESIEPPSDDEEAEMAEETSEENLQQQASHSGSDESVEFEINVYEHGGYYNHSTYGHLLYFPPNTVTEPSKVKCKAFSTHPILSPSKFTEGLASYIVEVGPSTLCLQKPIIVTLLHSGPGKKYGYETIVKVFDTTDTTWKEKEVLEDDSHAPEYCRSHFVQVRLKELSTLAVVSRLVTDRFKVTSKGCVVRSSVCDDVTVEFPKEAVANTTIHGEMQVLPNKEVLIDGHIVAYPALVFHGFQYVRFSKLVKIRIPLYSAEASVIPRLLCLDFDNDSNGKWKNVSDFKIVNGFMEFSVDHFSAFWALTSSGAAKYVVDTVNSCYMYWFCPKYDVSFAAYKKKGQTGGDDVDLKLTCVALDRQDTLNDKMEGKSFTTLVESNGDRPMRCREKAYPDLQDVSDWDKGFFLEFLGEDKECNKQFCINTKNKQIVLQYFNDFTERNPENRLCRLSLKTKSESDIDSSDVIEYFGIVLEELRKIPEDVAIKLLKYFKDLDYVKSLITDKWNTDGAKEFFSKFPRKKDCLEDLRNRLEEFEGAKYLADYLYKGHCLVTTPLRSSDDDIKGKVIDIVAENHDGYREQKLASYLGISKEFVDECRQRYSGHKQVSQILEKWVISSDNGTIEQLFDALRYLKMKKAAIALANFTTKLSKENQ